MYNIFLALNFFFSQVGCEVTTSNARNHTNPVTYKADAVLCTLPLGVLKQGTYNLSYFILSQLKVLDTHVMIFFLNLTSYIFSYRTKFSRIAKHGEFQSTLTRLEN